MKLEDDEVVETHISSTNEGKCTISTSFPPARDIFRREIVQPLNGDLICYALNVVEKLQDSEQNIFREAVKSNDGQLGYKTP